MPTCIGHFGPPVSVPGTSRCVVLVMNREDEQARHRQAPFKRQEPLIPVAKPGISILQQPRIINGNFSLYLGLCMYTVLPRW